MKKNTGKMLKKFLNITAILISICLSGCIEDTSSVSPENSAPQNSTHPTISPQTNTTTVTLVNENGPIAAGQTVYSSFTIKSAISINVNVNVTNGDGIMVYLLDDYTQLINLINGSSFIYNTVLSANYKVTSFNRSATLTAGTWYIAIINPNMLFSQTVSRIVTAY